MDSPIKWHGGKHYFAKKFIALMPPHIHYVEPYAGSLAVLLERDPNGVSEVVNDLNGELTNFWRVLRDPPMFTALERIIQAMPCSQVEFDAAGIEPPMGEDSQIAAAVRFFVRCRQSRAGCFKDFTTLAKTRVRRGMNELPSAWWTAIEGLPVVHERLKRVVILNQPALEVIRKQDTQGTFYYLDPPYVHSTRATKGQYAYEMSDQQHQELLNVLEGVKGKFLLSGYHSDMYEAWRLRNGFRAVEFKSPNHAAGGASKREMTEVVWCNFEPSPAGSK